MTSDDIRYEQQDQANERYINVLRDILWKLEEGTLEVNDIDSSIDDDNNCCEGYFVILSVSVV